MTEKQKKIAIIAATVILALILLLSSKRTVGNTIVNQQGVPDIQVTIPSMNIPDRSGIIINIPGLPSYTPYEYNAVSPCMCNGAESTSRYDGPLVAFQTVYNAGNSGPNIYRYSAPKPASMLVGSGVVGR